MHFFLSVIFAREKPFLWISIRAIAIRVFVIHLPNLVLASLSMSISLGRTVSWMGLVSTKLVSKWEKPWQRKFLGITRRMILMWWFPFPTRRERPLSKQPIVCNVPFEKDSSRIGTLLGLLSCPDKPLEKRVSVSS